KSGYRTKEGYIRKWYDDGKQYMEHCVVWEEHNGPIPQGMHIHHKDGNKENNNIENLELVDALTHKRYHSGCRLVNGIWEKQCNMCGEWYLLTEEKWYFHKSGKNAGYPIGKICKKCTIKRIVEYKRIRGARN
ncbi:MAG: HNH endonuclease, partial [Spirochaetaceae bacterium]|nr:HNH endonuclease [Spirochaetaceae bacterium]